MPAPLEPAKDVGRGRLVYIREADGLAAGVCAQTATARPCEMSRLLLVSWAGLRPRGLPARVRNAEAAVACDHLLHAQLEGWDAAILVHGIPADFRQCAPRPLVGLACTRIEGDGRRQSSRGQDDSHG